MRFCFNIFKSEINSSFLKCYKFLLKFFSNIFKPEINSSFLKWYKFLCYFSLFLIGLGALVRVRGAGLACPDWPLCFGEWIPAYDPKVYLEFFHRLFAGVLVLLTFVLHIPLLRLKDKELIPNRLKNLCLLSFFIIFLQVLMGALTVWLKLHTHIVVTHLALGLFLFSLYFWIYWSLERNFYFSLWKKQVHKKGFIDTQKLIHEKSFKKLKTEKWLKGFHYFIYFIFFILVLQILLGGQVSSSHAGLACPDFPLCHGKWFPTFKGLVGLQVQHRLMAYVLALLIFALTFLSYQFSYRKLKSLSLMLLSMLGLQIGIGVLNVLFGILSFLSVFHLVLAALMLMTVLKMIFEIRVEKKNTLLLKKN